MSAFRRFVLVAGRIGWALIIVIVILVVVALLAGGAAR